MAYSATDMPAFICKIQISSSIYPHKALTTFLYLLMCVYSHIHAYHALDVGDQRTTCKSHFSSSIMQVFGLGSKYFTHRAILSFFYMKLLLYNISGMFAIVLFSYLLLFIAIDLTKCSFLPSVNSDYFWVVSFGLFPPLYKSLLVEFFSSQ